MNGKLMTCVMYAGLLLITYSGCTLGPDYNAPPAETPPAWVQTTANVRIGQAPLAWWEQFRDPQLNSLINSALHENLTARTAAARVMEARGRYRAVTGQYYPQLDAVGAAQYSKESKNLTGADFEGLVYGGDLELRWELDLFGRITRSVEAAQAGVEASEEALNDVLLSLHSDVSLNYIALRTAQQRLIVAETNLRTQRETFDLTKARYDSGVSSELDVAQSAQILAVTETSIPRLEREVTEALNRLSVLLSQPPGHLRQQLNGGLVPPAPVEIITAIPADVVRQRPDVRQAERELAQATALIGVAKADLWPRLGLNGFVGLQTVTDRPLFDSDSFETNIGPVFRWRLLEWGTVRGEIEAQRWAREQAFLTYENQVLVALQEVEDAIEAYVRSREELAALGRAEDAAQRSLQLATGLYRDGLIEFQNVLDAQRQVLDAQDQAAFTRGTVARSVVQIYRAAGGGWQTPETQEIRSPREESIL